MSNKMVRETIHKYTKASDRAATHTEESAKTIRKTSKLYNYIIILTAASAVLYILVAAIHIWRAVS
jgi:hypothetical protein